MQSCINTSCPPNEKVGEISLSDNSLKFLPYTNKSVLVFKDQNGQELKFVSEDGITINKQELAVKDICSELKYDGRTAYEYFEGQYKYIHFLSKPEGYSFTLSIYTEVLKKEEKSFYDRLLLDLSGIGYLGRGEMVIDYRSNDNPEYKKIS